MSAATSQQPALWAEAPGAGRAERPAGGAPPHASWWLPLALLVSALSFLPGLSGGFVYDDLLMIGRNPLIRGFEHLPEIFGGAYWDFLDGWAPRVGYWRPLTAIALSVGHALGGGGPLAFHLLSLAVHLAAVAAAWRVAARYTGDRRVAFFTALLFGLHPTHVESVSWITALNDPLFGMLGLFAVERFLAWRERGSTGIPVAASLAFAAALLSKEMAVVVPVVVAALDFGRGPRPGGARLLRAYAGFALVLALYYLARVAVFGSAAAGLDHATTDFGVPAWRLLLLRLELLGGTIGLAFLPADLNLFRPFWPDWTAPDAPGLLAPALWTTAYLALGAWLAARSRQPEVRRLLGAWLVLPCAILPVLVRVESVGSFPLSDRFLYVGTLGPALLLSLGLLTPRRETWAPLFLGALALAAGWRTYARQGFWHDQETLFRTAAQQSPLTANVHWGLGRVLLLRYREEREQEPAVLAEAMAAFETARDLCEASLLGEPAAYTSRDDVLQSNLGYAWCLFFEAKIDRFHDFETPRRIFEEMTARYPYSEEAFTGLGVASSYAGDAAAADAAFAAAIERNPRYPEALFNRGLIAMEAREFDRAGELFEQNLAVRAGHVEGMVWLARAHEAAGRPDAARKVAERAREAAPEAPEPLVVLGILAGARQDYVEARRLLKKASELDPRHGPAHLERGRVLMALEDYKAAALALQKACELMPRSFDAHYNQGVLLSRLGREELALPFLLKAYELRPPGGPGDALRGFLVQRSAGNAPLMLELARVDRLLKRSASALDWADRALAADPDDGEATLVRGLAQADLDAHDEAVASLTAACTALPESFEAHHELGRLLFGLGREREAEPFLARALELIPEEEDGGAGLYEAVRASIERRLAVARGE